MVPLRRNDDYCAVAIPDIGDLWRRGRLSQCGKRCVSDCESDIRFAKAYFIRKQLNLAFVIGRSVKACQKPVNGTALPVRIRFGHPLPVIPKIQNLSI
jgi:hypothetical protein